MTLTTTVDNTPVQGLSQSASSIRGGWTDKLWGRR